MTVVTSWDLFEDRREMQDEMLRLNRMRALRFGQLGQQYDDGTTKAAWAPMVDISERKDAYLVMVELPGVGLDDLEITFQDDLLTIQGERYDAHDAATEKLHRVERRYGTFRRSITLPSHVMADGIEATTQDGVLQILVPKAAEVVAKRIQVRVSQKHANPAPAAEGQTSS
ncbi:MAG TPA: Hsp20/alpha crystallin family protein [Micromonosporaceae bacterium]|nr:Hsp20/alpha crystallin family protein [Micromonosporaceae bacterium]